MAQTSTGFTLPHPSERLKKDMYDDAAIPGIENKMAFRQTQDVPGYWMTLDMNSFRDINAVHGHALGDSVIKAVGTAISQTILQSPYAKKARGFRAGGDNFAVWAETPEALPYLLRQIHTRMDQIPLIGGTHKVSIGAGMGRTVDEANQSLAQAKTTKNTTLGPHAIGHVTHSTL